MTRNASDRIGAVLTLPMPARNASDRIRAVLDAGHYFVTSHFILSYSSSTGSQGSILFPSGSMIYELAVGRSFLSRRSPLRRPFSVGLQGPPGPQ